MNRLLLVTTLAFLLFFTAACGSGNSSSPSHTPSVTIESQFQPVVDSFTAEAVNQGANVTISDLVIQSVPSLSGDSMGYCQTDASGASSPTIVISQAYWNVLDNDGQQELLFHELGHCVLNRAHDDTLNDGVPESMMNGVFMGSDLYNANKSQYLHELFSQSNLPDAFPLSVPWNALLPDFSAQPNS